MNTAKASPDSQTCTGTTLLSVEAYSLAFTSAQAYCAFVAWLSVPLHSPIDHLTLAVHVCAG